MKPSLLGVGLAFLAGCGANHAPVLQPLSDQVAAVGIEVSLELRATDADGDTLHFDFDAPRILDIKSRAQLSSFADNVAIFRWTPQASDRDVEPYAFDFKVTDGTTTTTETVYITVSDDAGGTAPVFRQPLGTGTTLDLAKEMCIDVEIVVEDTDSTMVTLAEEEPLIEGAELTQNDAFGGVWHWCPSDEQIAQQDRWMLHLSADDGTNKTEKSYLIVLRTPPGMNCPGTPPVITHEPLTADSTVLDLQVLADIEDDLGVKSVLLYWTTTMPKDPPDIASMNPVVMNRTSGDALAGSYEAAIPNPVATAMAGTKKTVYYLIEAKDNDDAVGTCDHVTADPGKGTYAVDITAPATMTRGTKVNCDACTADIQCAQGYQCINVAGGKFCAAECNGAGTCEANYSCSSAVLTSVDGKMAHFCRATSMTCPPMSVCNEDSLEDNDTRTNIPDPTSANLPPGTQTNLVVCPRNGGTSADEDWYAISLPTDAIVTAEIKIKDYSVGSHADLDLELTDANGDYLDFSFGTGTTEYVSACQPASAGKVYAHIMTFDSTVVASKYDLTVTRTGPDANEAVGDNDSNTNVLLGSTGASVTQNICLSDDWFITFPNDRQKMIVDLKYTARSTNEDLTLNLFRDNCQPSASPIPVVTGQPVDGGVRIDYNTPDGGSANCYYFAVGAAVAGGGNVYQLNSVQTP